MAERTGARASRSPDERDAGPATRLAIDGGEPVRATLPAVRPPGHRRRRHRGGHGRPALRLADDRAARPGVRGRPGRGDRRAARRRVQLRDRRAPRGGRGGRSRAGRRGDHDADDLRRHARTAVLYAGADAAVRRRRPGHAADRPGRASRRRSRHGRGRSSRSTTPASRPTTTRSGRSPTRRPAGR